MQIYKFRNCFLNTFERRVIRDGKNVELTPRTFDVLQLLVERAGEIVTKDEMLGKVWNGSFVEESNLPVHIAKLRRFLDETEGGRSIETVHGTGYRFIAPMESVNSEAWHKQLSGSGRRRTDKTPTAFAFDSIAVLPLRNESDNPEIDYLADGLTESFINSLSRIPDVKVLARDTVFRYKNRDTDPKDVGETLGVSAILTGRIRVIGDRLAISVELVKVADGSQLWGSQFNHPFAGIIKTQEEITSAVSDQLLLNISKTNGAAGVLSTTQSPESYRLYLKGKHFLKRRKIADVWKALDFFEQSISKDPTNVLPYVEIVECNILLYALDDLTREIALANIHPALSILNEFDQPHDAVHATLGGKSLIFYWDFVEAEKHLLRALRLNPNSLLARYRYSNLLTFTGRLPAAMEELQQIMKIDPLSLSSSKRIGRLFYFMRQYENSVSHLTEALELEPADDEALLLLGAALSELGHHNESLTIFQKSLNQYHSLEALSMIGYVGAKNGDEDSTRGIVKQLESKLQAGCFCAVKLARINSALGEKEEAFRWLNLALQQHDMDLIGLQVDPRWAPLSDDKRFVQLTARVGLRRG